ncbi:MAG: glycosyltransferase [archaeon GBS-70-058]|nr:glycosyltransferase [Candidatus Culexarchaeum nevadense]
MTQITIPAIQPIQTITLITIMYALTWAIIIIHAIYYWTGIKGKYREAKIVEKKLNEYPKTTIIIPVRNEEAETIIELLEALSKQTYPKDKMEIIIVSDDTEQKFKEIKERIMKTEYMRNMKINMYRRNEPKGFKAGALNYAIQKSSGKYIAVFDVDTIPKETFLEETITHMETEGLDALATKWSTKNIDASPIAEAQAVSMEFLTSIILKGKKILGKPIIIPGSGCIFKRETLIEIGGWDEEDGLGEDLEISIKLILNGKKIDYMDEVDVKVEVPSSYEDFKKQQSRWAYGATRVLMKNLSKIIKANIPLTWKIDITLHLLQYHAILANFAIAILALLSIIMKTDLMAQATFLIPVTIALSALEAIAYMHTAKRLGLKTWRSIVMMGRCTALAAVLAPQVLIQNIKVIIGKEERWEVTPKGATAKKTSSRRATIIENMATIIGVTAILTLIILGYKMSALCILTLTLPYAYVAWKTNNHKW